MEEKSHSPNCPNGVYLVFMEGVCKTAFLIRRKNPIVEAIDSCKICLCNTLAKPKSVSIVVSFEIVPCIAGDLFESSFY